MKLNYSFLPHTYAICQLKPTDSIHSEIYESPFYSIPKTSEELSIVCPEEYTNDVKTKNSDWKILKLHGPLDFSLVGILAKIATVLANANISIFAISTFDTDYILKNRICKKQKKFFHKPFNSSSGCHQFP